MEKRLMNGWAFALGAHEEAVTDPETARSWRRVDLPHDWQIESVRSAACPDGASQGYYSRGQQGWYCRSFFAPEEWRDKVVRICFDGVQRFSTVWLNGRELGSRPYGYVPFAYEMNAHLNYGQENHLVVRVDNSRGGGDRWYSGAGIFRDVTLSALGLLHIRPGSIRVTTPEVREEAAAVHVTVGLENRASLPCDGVLELEWTGPDGTKGRQTAAYTLSGRSAQELAVDFTIDRPLLWEPEHPHLYGLKITLNGEAYTLRFGIRTAVFDGDKGFFLNGRSCKLRGVNLHHDGGAVGAAVPPEVWRRRFGKLKELGCNALRCSHNPQAAAFYDLADEMGFLVIDELYDKWAPTGLYFQEFFEEWWERDLEAMIARDVNHPSVILWSVGNEIEFQYEERFYELTEAMCRKTRALDPTRPVSLALMPYCLPGFNDRTSIEKRLAATLRLADIVDVLMLNYMESHYRELREAGLRKAVIGSEVYTYYRSCEGQFTQMYPHSPYQDVRDNEYVAGSFIWAGIDYFGEAATGWPCRGWTGSVLDSAAFRKPRSWYVESQWKEEPVLKLAVFTEEEPWDMANVWWGFPQMQLHWNFTQRGKLMHVAAMTNCDEVRLYVNDDPVRMAKPEEAGDGMAHFYVPCGRGRLRAEGFRGGRVVAQDVLETSGGPAYVELVPDRAVVEADGRSIVQVEIWLKDSFGRPWVKDMPVVRCSIQGDAEIIAMDNGDFNTTTERYATQTRTIFQGHALALVRTGRTPGVWRMTASVEGCHPVCCDIEAVAEQPGE